MNNIYIITSLKLKIISAKILFISIILLYWIISYFIANNIPYFYLLFAIIWFSIALIFKNDNTIFYSEKIKKISKKTDFLTIWIILLLIFIRFFIFAKILEQINLEFVELALYIISFSFFIFKLYFMFNSIIKVWKQNKIL